jgi:hypothetical protein
MEVQDTPMAVLPSVVLVEIVFGVVVAEALVGQQQPPLVRLVVQILVQEVVVLQLLTVLQDLLVVLVVLV